MNLFALLCGVIIAAAIVKGLHHCPGERATRLYAALLATFPLYYWAFALYAGDSMVLLDEMVIGIGFFALAYVAITLRKLDGLIILACGFIVHGVYDLIHPTLFVNPGTPLWWPEFCAAVDTAIGVYLLHWAITATDKHMA
ncbi:hypothetical protein LJ739_08045 [Aestuariibacter halophilus]|uniref:Uncharacterized protein n=1 Tax=Fluctibacter halophilus TaxID=226011 RepID=A0ABS8G6H0_9ALTE|nr:hypothetical protein [Aestuariibacter halophilus]MCC2616187.1 hypothetical protein [Aestuariibacter halophilus]